MTVENVNISIFGGTYEPINSAGKTLCEKTDNNVTSFSDVLNKKISGNNSLNGNNDSIRKNDDFNAAQKLKQADGKDEAAEVSKAVEETSDESGNETKTNVFDEKLKVKDTEDNQVDEMTVQQIADALSQIIEQIKELLGISDEELIAGMESMEIQPKDLLGDGKLAQLLTVVAGDGEAISLVTNEELYTALQSLNETVEAVKEELLDNTGLTKDELEEVLEQLKNISANEEQPAVTELTDEEQLVTTETVNASANEEQSTVMIVEDNTVVIPQAQETAKKSVEQLTDDMIEELPENRQENQESDTLKLQSKKTEHDSGNGGKNTNDFNGQQEMMQNTNNDTTAVETAAKPISSYASENTENILRQLADAVKIIKNENLTEMELQMHPASLGTVNVSLVTKGGSVTAEFTTQNEAVRAAIESQVSQLVSNLEQQGVKVEAVEVSVAGHELEKNLDEKSNGEQSRKEQEEKQRIQGVRRNSINLRAFESGDELAEEMQEADDATRIAMEMMTANGNSMDLMA